MTTSRLGAAALQQSATLRSARFSPGAGFALCGAGGPSNCLIISATNWIERKCDKWKAEIGVARGNRVKGQLRSASCSKETKWR